jgi:gliding motility-associated-like protein
MLKKFTLLLLLLNSIFYINANAQVVPTGAGSYTSTFPVGPYATAPNLHYLPGDNFSRSGTRQPKVVAGWAGPIPANEWWSSAIWNYENTNWLISPYSFNMYPHPLIVGATRYGLKMTYEDNPVVAGNDYHYYRETHLYVGVKGMDIPASIGTKVKSNSDWAVTMRWDDAAGKSLEATSGHGFPFVYFTKAGGDVTLRFQVPPTTYATLINGPVMARGVTILGKNYGIFMPLGTTFGSAYALTYNEADVPADNGPLCCVNRDAMDATLPAGQNYFSIAVLPDNSPATLAYYAKYAFSFITDTKSTYTYNEASNKVVTTFTATTQAQGSSTETGTLLALYRHQWKHSTAALTSYQYKSPRGDMKVFQGNSFTTEMTNNGFLPSMPNAYSNKGQMFTYVDNEFKKPYVTHFPDKQSGYYAGKNLQRVANLIEIAHQAKHFAARDTFRAYAKRYMQFWFDASGGKNEQVFYYDSKWNSLTAYPSAYESDRQLNDHHFGYGYFVKAAATIARFEPNSTWATNWGPMVEMLIKDVADGNRNDPQFPYLRNFDPYAGHSWASGHANFNKGNNEESGSESLNFASGLALWGLATGNAALRDLGIYMYVTEETAVRQYWFDEDKAVFPAGFTPNFGSIIWGWGAEYQTWFAGDPEHVQGISYLPITGGSLYLGYNPTAAASNYANLVSKTGSTTQTTDFKDVIWQYQALSDAATAKSKFFAAGNYTPEGGETMAHTLHWIANLDSMGVVDTTVIADMASFAVFKKGGCKHYVVYNPPAPFNHTCVNYSDGNSWRLPKADSLYVFKKCPNGSVIPTFTVCKGVKLRLAAKDSLQGKGNYIWDFNGGASIAGAKDSIYSPIAFATGSYHVKYGCTFTKGDTFNVVVKDTVSYTSPIFTCNAGKYSVSLTLSGGSGNPANYSLTGVNASAGVTFLKNGSQYNSSFIASGPYEFLVQDAQNNCSQYTIKGTYSCLCTTKAGTMNQTPVAVCDTSTAKTSNTGTPVLGPNDLLLYYLHSGKNSSLGTVYGNNTRPAFQYTSALTYGTTYYISAVAGRKNTTGGIDLTDPCLSVAPGTPVVFNANPIVNLGKDTVLCQLASLTLDAGAGSSYLWSGNEVTRKITINASGTYSVKVTDANGCSGKGSINITPVTAPVILNFTETCTGLTSYKVTFDISSGDAASYQVLVNGSGPGGPGTLTGGSFASASIPSGTSYSFIVKDKYACTPNTLSGNKNCSCQTKAGSMGGAVVNVCENNIANVPASTGSFLDPDDALIYYLHTNNGSSLGTVMATNTLPSFGYTASLTYGATYYISAVAGNKNGSGGIDLTDPCLSVSKGTPVIFNAKPTAVISGTQQICAGTSASLSVALTGKSPWNISYSDGTTSTSVNAILNSPYTFLVSKAATYTLTAVSDAVCTSGSLNGTALVKTKAIPDAKLSGSTTICTGSTTPLSIALAGMQPWTVTYSDGIKNTAISNITNSPYTFNVGQSGNYVLVQVVDASTCNGTISGNAKIKVKPLPTSNISGTKEICQNGPSTPITISLTGTQPWTLTYTDGTSPLTVTNILASPYIFNTSKAGTYTVTALSDSLCTGTSFTGSASISYATKKNPKITTVPPVCLSRIPFTLTTVDTGGVWSGNGISNPKKGIFNPALAGKGRQLIKYIITSNCRADSDTTSIVVIPIPIVKLGKDSSLCSGDTVRLRIDTIYTALWQDGSKGSTFTVKAPGTYTVIASNGQCTKSDSIRYNNDCPYSLYIPDAFSPNGDLNNEVFQAKGDNIYDFDMAVYNRWGEQIFFSNDINKGWDGKNEQGKEYKIDIYVYLIHYTTHIPGQSNVRYAKIGRISMIR